MNDCATIIVHGLPSSDLRERTSLRAQPDARDTTYLAACRAVPDTADRSTLMARQREVDVVFDRLEDACPTLFRPRRLVSLHEGDIWRRLYGGTDLSAWLSHGRLKFVDLSRPNGIADLGPERDWAKATPQLECGIHDGVYFVHIARSSE